MTSVFMIFEITQDYQILVPLLVANLLSFLISKHYQPLPIYEALLLQDNIHLSKHASPRHAGTTAGDVMTASDATLDAPPPLHVHPDHSLAVVMERLAEAEHELPVVSREDSRHVVGMVTLADVRRAIRQSRHAGS
jgi:CIC family chloride channel protein